MSYTLNKNQLVQLANGCCFFASGGGGSLTSGLNLLKQYPEDGSTKFATKKEAMADTDAYTLVVAYIGAPDAIENLDTPKAAVQAYNLMNEITGGKIKYIVPVEQGSLSTIVSCVVAEELGLSVVDGDGAGRAVPELTMLTYADTVPMANQKTPEGQIIPAAIIASKDGQKVEMMVSSAETVESMVRPFISSGIAGFDQAAGLAIWLMNSSELNTALPITGTIETSFKLGEYLSSLSPEPSNQNYVNILNFLSNQRFNASWEFVGIMTTPIETTGGGFDTDKIIINGIETFAGVDMHIYALNENLIAWRTDKPYPVIIAPDSICYMTKDGQAFSNADISNSELNIIGQNVGVFALQSRAELTNSKPIMSAFNDVLTTIGYPGGYKPWNKLA